MTRKLVNRRAKLDTTRDMRERTHTVRVGTFADGQRGGPLTATYSAEIGSFGDADRKVVA
ncbi:MAG: hypothetical protein ACJ780_15750 [Solirubrobacteraceae bacterium]